MVARRGHLRFHTHIRLTPSGGGPYAGSVQPTEPNPYAAPQVDNYAPELDAELQDASTAQRLLTFVLDYVGFLVLAFGIGVGSVLITGDADWVDDVPDFLFGVILMTIYYVGFEATLGRTPGKLVAGTRVVNEQGGAPSILQVLGRTFSRFAPFEAFSAFGGGQMWHDSWSSTRVVTTR
jgi:uncharacterized RDD family membrane protein YckC